MNYALINYITSSSKARCVWMWGRQTFLQSLLLRISSPEYVTDIFSFRLYKFLCKYRTGRDAKPSDFIVSPMILTPILR